MERLDSQRGALFASSFEYPGRYTCWDIGFYNPPLVLTCKQHYINLQALNPRGEVLLSFIYPLLVEQNYIELCSQSPSFIHIKIKTTEGLFSEEERSKQPST